MINRVAGNPESAARAIKGVDECLRIVRLAMIGACMSCGIVGAHLSIDTSSRILACR